MFVLNKRVSGPVDSQVVLHHIIPAVANVILFGLLLIFAIHATVLLVRRRSERRSTVFVFAGTIILMALNASYTALSIFSLVALVRLEGQLPTGPGNTVQNNIRVLERLSPYELAGRQINVTVIALLDVIMIHRCHLVFRWKWLTAFTSFLTLTGSVMGYWANTVFRYFGTPAESAFQNKKLGRFSWLAHYYVLVSFIVSILTSGLLIGKIWLQERQTKSTLGTSKLTRALHTFMESAALQMSVLLAWTVFVLCNLKLYRDATAAESIEEAGSRIIEASAPPILGITFCLLIIRLSNREGSYTSPLMPTREIHFNMPASQENSTAPEIVEEGRGIPKSGNRLSQATLSL